HESCLLHERFRRITGNARCKVESSGEFAFCKIGERDQLDSVSGDRIAHARASENLDLELRLGRGRDSADIGGRMEIQFRSSVADTIEHADDVILAQMTALVKSEQRVGRDEAALRHHAAGSARERAEDKRLDELAGSVIPAQTQRRQHALAREPEARHFVFDGEVNQNISEERMDVEIQVAVDMVEVADELEMALDLRA